jgi:hypothetical protein
MKIKQQTSRDPLWSDEQGTTIPYNRTTPVERMKERFAYKIANSAAKINRDLVAFKKSLREMCDQVFKTVMTEKEIQKATKGNFTWYNFDGSIKIEVSINENIEFDGMLIEKCKQKLMELVGESISNDKIFIKELVLGAFQTSKGKLDTKKVLSLKKHSSRIKDKRYAEAMDYLDKSIRRPDSKTYFRVWVRDDSGAFQHIDLNFSSVS